MERVHITNGYGTYLKSLKRSRCYTYVRSERICYLKNCRGAKKSWSFLTKNDEGLGRYLNKPTERDVWWKAGEGVVVLGTSYKFLLR